MKNYKELIVWQKGIDLVTSVYCITKNFPREEQFGLISQIRRASISIPSNIAEGFGRKSQKDFKRFLQITIGSLFEVQTYLEISKNLQYLSENDFKLIFDSTREIEAMLTSLIKKIKE